MQLFRRQHSPDELGAMIYEALRAGMTTDGPLSLTGLLRQIQKQPDDVEEQYVGEVMIASMYGATMAIERSAPKWILVKLITAMRVEFLQHLAEQGASVAQVKEWDKVLDNRFERFSATLDGYEGFEPPWKLGRQFLWNVIGEEEYVATSIKAATLFIHAARDVAQDLMNKYGPTLLAGPAR